MLPGEPGNTSLRHAYPTLLLMAFHYGINDIHHACAIVEGRKLRCLRHRSRLHGAVELHHHIFKGVRPAFDVPDELISAEVTINLVGEAVEVAHGDGIVDQHVGSRVVILIPSADAAGDGDRIAVVDILAVLDTAA